MTDSTPTDPADRDERWTKEGMTVVFTEARPGVVEVTVEALRELLAFAGWRPDGKASDD